MFDLDAAFDADYLRFYRPEVDGDVAEHEAATIAELLQLEPGETVLDLACGHGRIAVPLARGGFSVTGLDRQSDYLAAAERAAADAGVVVDWRAGDLRELRDDARFDAAFSWFTSFGYFDEATDRDVLARVFRALRPGGRFLLETANLFRVVLEDDAHVVLRDGHDLMIDHRTYDPITGRQTYHRTFVGGERPPRDVEFSVRVFTFPELRDWLTAAGFVDVVPFGADGEPFATDSERLIVTCRRP